MSRRPRSRRISAPIRRCTSLRSSASPTRRSARCRAAFIELKPGASASTDELTAYCTGQIARFKIPRYWRFVESWPMSATKIQKAQLRDQLLAEVR